jgi:hypothetical protein
MEPHRSFPPPAGYAVSFKVRVSYTVETDGTGYSASAWSKPVGGYVRFADKNETAGAADAELCHILGPWVG